MEVRHGALSTANEIDVIIASAISSISSCQINTIDHHHSCTSMYGIHKDQFSFLIVIQVNLF